MLKAVFGNAFAKRNIRTEEAIREQDERFGRQSTKGSEDESIDQA